MSYSCADFAQDVFNECEHLGIVDLSTVTASDDALLQEQAELTLKAIRVAVQAMRRMHSALRAISDSVSDEAPEEEDYDDTESAYNNGVEVGAYQTAAIAREALAQIEGEEAPDTAEVEPEPVGRYIYQCIDPTIPDELDSNVRWIAASDMGKASAYAREKGWVRLYGPILGGLCFEGDAGQLQQKGVDVVL